MLQVDDAQLKPLSVHKHIGSYKPAQQLTVCISQNRRWRTRAELNVMYWRTLKTEYRGGRIQFRLLPPGFDR